MTFLLERHLNELEIRFREVSTQRGFAPRLSSLLVRLLGQVGNAQTATWKSHFLAGSWLN